MARSEITLRRVQWSETVRDHVVDINHMPPHFSVNSMRRDVDIDGALALGVFASDEHLATFICQFEDGDIGTEFVICGAGGDVPGLDVIEHAYPALEGLARDRGCMSMRFHTARTGLIARMGKYGYRFAEATMRKVPA